jgi:asparagine synthase (glutamine-hydrolysing)
MCGITGEVHFSFPPDQTAVARMTRALAHRGPDAEGFFVEGPVALGHRRLSILDLEGGVQPMTRDGVTLVFNGQAYNHDALRDALKKKGHPFTTRSDTEVVLRAYLEWGEAFVERLHGMFAMALYDRRHERLVLARDRLGKKPLYYALGRGGGWAAAPVGREREPATRLVFGSELKALIAHGAVPREVSPDAVAKYLAVEYVPAPHSIFKHVHKLPAAHVAVLDESGFRARRYWELPAARDEGLSEDAAAERLIELLDAAVAKRLVADVPVGVFLSGGVDSTGIAALATRHKRPLSTFSIGFSEASFDESAFAKLAADALGTDHHAQVLSGEACVELLPDVVAHMDEPFADPSILPTALLSRFVRKHVTVALAGDGGDELFAGYDTFLAHGPAALVSSLPAAALRLLQAAVERLPAASTNMSLDFRLKQLFRGLLVDGTLRHQAWISSFSPTELEGLLARDLRPAAAEANVFAEVLEDAARGRALGIRPGSVDEALRFFLTRYLADDILVKADRASMMASLEVRAPFLDTDVVEFALSLPWQHKLSLGKTKRVLRRALTSIVPLPILRRPKKGFGIPVARWIRGPLRSMFEDLFSPRALEASGLVDPAAARQLLGRHLSNQADLRKPLWTLAMLLLWQRHWAASSSATTAPQALSTIPFAPSEVEGSRQARPHRACLGTT